MKNICLGFGLWLVFFQVWGEVESAIISHNPPTLVTLDEAVRVQGSVTTLESGGELVLDSTVSPDTERVYVFRLSSDIDPINNRVEFHLIPRGGDVDFYVFDYRMNKIRNAQTPGHEAEVVETRAHPGRLYFLRLISPVGGEVSFRLMIRERTYSFQPSVADPGASFEEAHNLGLFQGELTVTQRIVEGDVDFFIFSIYSPGRRFVELFRAPGGFPYPYEDLALELYRIPQNESPPVSIGPSDRFSSLAEYFDYPFTPGVWGLVVKGARYKDRGDYQISIRWRQ